MASKSRPKRNFDKVSASQTQKIHNADEKKKFKVSLPKFKKFKFGKKKEKSDPREIRLKKIDSDMVAWNLALLSPSPGEGEQLIILQRNSDGSYAPILYDEDGSDIGVTTDPDDVAEIYMKSKPRTLIDIHTHPEWSAPSRNDVSLFLEFDSIAITYLITPKTTDQGVNIVYQLEKTKISRKDYNKDDFEKDWKDTEPDAEKELKRRDDANLDWFTEKDLLTSVDKDRNFARDIKRIEILGKKYGFKVTAFENDTFLLGSDIEQKPKSKKSKKHGMYDDIDLHPDFKGDY